jgi:serine protease inhibitor
MLSGSYHADYNISRSSDRNLDNNRLSDRNFMDSQINIQQKNTHEMNINRLSLERNQLFSNDSKYNPSSNKGTSKHIGEITGDPFNKDNLEQGMPIRSMYQSRKTRENTEQARLDFDLYDDDQPEQELNVNYYDPSGASKIDFADVGTTGSQFMSKQTVDPVTVVSSSNNDYGLFMSGIMHKYMNDEYCISNYLLMSSFAALYVASKGNTELELKQYFDFIDKTNLYKGLVEINNYVEKSQIIKQKNIILADKELPINADFYNYIKPLVNIFKIDTKNYKYEAMKLGAYLKSLYNDEVSNISENLLKNTVITILNTCLIKPIWTIQFANMGPSSFYGKSVKQINMMSCNGKSANYMEDSVNQVLELIMADGLTAMGIVLPKSNVFPTLTTRQYDVYISNMKPTVLESITIPIFKHTMKIRLSSLLKKSGLENVFVRADFPELIPDTANITDVVQNISFVMSTQCVKNDRANGPDTNISFEANHSFIYYVRNIKTNMVLLIGTYF